MNNDQDIDGEVIGFISETVYFKYILFSLGDEIFGIDALRVKEIVEYRHVTQVPMVDKTICGVTNLRGMVIPIVDLSLRLGKKNQAVSRKTCTIILEIEHENEKILLGAKIDAINSVVNLAENDVQPAPTFGADIPMEFIEALGAYDGGFISLLNIDNIFSIDELTQFASNQNYVTNFLRNEINP